MEEALKTYVDGRFNAVNRNFGKVEESFNALAGTVRDLSRAVAELDARVTACAAAPLFDSVLPEVLDD